MIIQKCNVEWKMVWGSGTNNQFPFLSISAPDQNDVIVFLPGWS